MAVLEGLLGEPPGRVAFSKSAPKHGLRQKIVIVGLGMVAISLMYAKHRLP